MNIPEAIDCLNVLQGTVYDEMTYEQKAIQVAKEALNTINEAVELAMRYGSIDGDHHKMWVIDQMVRVLTGPSYDDVITEHNIGEDGPNTYEWEVGIPP